MMESEKPRTLNFDLNQDPKYDTGLVCGGTLEVFVEPVLPPALLYVFGAGHVAVNLCQTAANAGFDVVVTDDRTSYATKERFPAAREVHALDFDEAMRKLDPNESSYIVIVTRGHRDDMRILRWAVQTRARYVGMIGSKRKVIEIFKTLQQKACPRICSTGCMLRSGSTSAPSRPKKLPSRAGPTGARLGRHASASLRTRCRRQAPLVAKSPSAVRHVPAQARRWPHARRRRRIRQAETPRGTASHRSRAAPGVARVAAGGHSQGLVVDGDVEFNDLGDNHEVKEDEYGAEPNIGRCALRSAQERITRRLAAAPRSFPSDQSCPGS